MQCLFFTALPLTLAWARDCWPVLEDKEIQILEPLLGSPGGPTSAQRDGGERSRCTSLLELAKIELLSRCSNGAAAAAAVPALRVRRELLWFPASAKIALICGNEVHKDGMVFARRSSMVEPPGGGCGLN